MRSAVESLPNSRTGYYPGQFTEKMERRGQGLSESDVGGSSQQTQVKIPEERGEERRGPIVRSWRPWPSWSIRYLGLIVSQYSYNTVCP